MEKVLIVGSLNMDMVIKLKSLPKLGETILADNFYKSCGGKGANQAITASKLGLNVEMIGAVGKDEDGEELISNLKNNGIKPFIVFKDKPTGRAIINIDENGNNNIVVIPGANLELSKEDILEKLDIIKSSDIVILQNEISLETTKFTLEMSNKLGKITLFNPAPATKLEKDIYKHITYLIVNETELEYIFDINVNENDFIDKFLKIKKENGIKNVLITLGEKGSIIFLENNTYLKFEAYKVKAIDTTAAGDSFIGAFTSYIVKGKKIEEAIKYASIVSAIVVTKIGAQDSIPSIEEINEFIIKNNI